MTGGRAASPSAVNATALAGRVVAVRIDSGWSNVPDRPALAAAAGYWTATEIATVPSGVDAAVNTVRSPETACHVRPWLGWRGAAAPDVRRRPVQVLPPGAACGPP